MFYFFKRAESAHAKLKRHLGSSQGDFESSWNVINALIELQHTEIKASFERSISVVEHQFNNAMFKELRGMVSRASLNMILMEFKRATQVDIDKGICGCVNRTSYGLPCAHELGQLIKEGRTIPLDSVHSHWRKLDTVTDNVSSELTISTEIDSILRQFADCDEAGKIALKRKLRELACLATTSMCPPLEKVKGKGRPSLKINLSTKRAPSSFEIVESAHDSTSPATACSVKAPKEKKLKYIKCFPHQIREHIVNIMDVKADGHCGYRSIAGLLGMGEDGWATVRHDLVRELHTFHDEYVQLYGSIDRVAELVYSLSWFDSFAPYDRWMTLPDMGHLIASRYNIVLVHLSIRQCLTYLPLRSVSPAPLHHKLIALGFVEDCHFVQVC